MTTHFVMTLSGAGLLTLALTGDALSAQDGKSEGTMDSPPIAVQPYVPPTESSINPVADPQPGSAATAGDQAPASPAINMVGYPVQNLQGERLGEVDTLLVTAEGQVTAIVIGAGGLLGMGKDRYEIPWSQVQWPHNGQYLTVDATPDQMRAEFSAFESK